MAAIRSLLNPMVSEKNHDSTEELRDDQSTHDSQASAFSDAGGEFQHKPSRKKQKICKDAAVFKPGSMRGECRYPPYEDDDDDDLLAAKHQMFEVYPIGNIASYPRHIPYNSEKKLYLEKTGRESFEGMEIKRMERVAVQLTLTSLPISVQDPGGFRHLHDAVGLQHWLGSNNAFVQVRKLFEGA